MLSMFSHLPTPIEPALFAVLESDLILPEQFFPQRAPSWSGEITLLWAVFTDGVESFRKEVLRGREEGEDFIEILDWISDSGSESVFSFERLCETFGLESGRARTSLQAWRERHHVIAAATASRSQAA